MCTHFKPVGRGSGCPEPVASLRSDTPRLALPSTEVIRSITGDGRGYIGNGTEGHSGHGSGGAYIETVMEAYKRI
jgi:hypothetical protein